MHRASNLWGLLLKSRRLFIRFFSGVRWFCFSYLTEQRIFINFEFNLHKSRQKEKPLNVYLQYAARTFNRIKSFFVLFFILNVDKINCVFFNSNCLFADWPTSLYNVQDFMKSGIFSRIVLLDGFLCPSETSPYVML